MTDRRRSLGVRVAARTVIILALAALLTGCGKAAMAVSPTATPTLPISPTATPSPIPLPPAPLTWRTATLPAGVPGGPGAVAPSEGATAYICQEPGPSSENGTTAQPKFWATHDYAAHWTRMASIPADKVYTECLLHVDAYNPLIVVAIFLYQPAGAGGGPSIAGNWVSFNGGASWRKLTNGPLYEMDLQNPTATRNGITYAIRGVIKNNIIFTGLWVSGDHMTTWRSIDPPGYGAANYSTFAQYFWLSPATGEIIAVYGSSDALHPAISLWESHDGGAQWTQLSAPWFASQTTDSSPFVAWSSAPNAPLTICNTSVGVAADDQSGDFPLFCSQDDGKTWKTRPNITPVDAAENTPQEAGHVFAIASDGSLLAFLPGQPKNSLYRLAPSAAQWQSLGDIPSSGFTATYCNTASGGVFWSVIEPSSPAVANLKTA